MPVKVPRADFPVPISRGRGGGRPPPPPPRYDSPAVNVPSTVFVGGAGIYRGGIAAPLIDRRDIGVIQNPNDFWKDYRRIQPVVVPPRVIPPAQVRPGPVISIAGPASPTNPSTGRNREMGLFSDVYDTLDTSLGGWLPGGVPVGSGNVISAANNPVFASPSIMNNPATAARLTGQPMTSDAASCGTGCDSPRYLTYDCRTGEFKKKRRRRRRAMLTLSDKDTLTFISSLSSNANVKSALAARISRS